MKKIHKIISGGQTGVDRAALDHALHKGIPHGGYCPKDRLAEDGHISEKYKLVETNNRDVRFRTELNVRTSDATLIFQLEEADKGTVDTINYCREYRKSHLVKNIKSWSDKDVEEVTDWLSAAHIKTLNIAGPRESNAPGIYQEVRDFLKQL